jgi:hypothetical protein
VAKFQNPRAVSASSSGAENLRFERADWTSFRTLEGLQQKAGVALDGLVALVLKELADNALDAGAKVAVGEIDGGYFIEDDGEGIDPDEVARLFSIARPLTSTKMLRLPTRGALGNGLRVAAGAVLASGGKLAVETRGVKLILKPQRDGTTSSTRRAVKRRAGTRIEISFGASLPKDHRALSMTTKAISLAKGGASYTGQSSPYWYDGPQFRFNERNLFYRLRPIVQDEIGQELKISNFKSIIDAYEQERGEIRLMYRDPRGSLVHPHSDEVISLGTLMAPWIEAWTDLLQPIDQRVPDLIR